MLFFVALLSSLADNRVVAADGVFVRFKLVQPSAKTARYYVRLGGYIHKTPWYLPRGVTPTGADKMPEQRTTAGEYTPWLDVKKFSEGRLHGEMKRAGGVAEFPNMTADFVVDPPAERLTVVIELATAANQAAVVKSWRETMTGSLTSFLVSPNLTRDAERLETAAEMSARRLRWARAATGGKRHSPQSLIVQTSFWAPQRAELNRQESEVLHLLGFNVVGNQRPQSPEPARFAIPGHTHGIKFGPAATRAEIDTTLKTHVERFTKQTPPQWRTIPFNFGDEVCCRPTIGDNAAALAHFHAWLALQKIGASDLGVKKLTEVKPIEKPEQLKKSVLINGPSARRTFYYTTRFRQHAATERVRWHTDSFHRHLQASGWLVTENARKTREQVLTSTLVADHPYFAGSGLGMGMTPNPAWSGHPLAMDWFELARKRSVDLIGIEDWMGLQYMYGPNWTWEGFQLMGFQASIFRSGSRGEQPTIAWITPSDETNLRLKSASALCQGAKHFYYWTYGPTATSTENYWSDLQGAYHGIAAMTRHLAKAEHLIAPGRTRKTRVALLYSISSDLWQPFGYVHMLERRGTYLSLVHDQYLVDMLTEEDIAAGRLNDYDVLYATDPCIKTAAAKRISAWVAAGGHLCATTAAGCRDEFNEPSNALTKTFGIDEKLTVRPQAGRYHIRGALNGIEYMGDISVGQVPHEDAKNPTELAFGVIGCQVGFITDKARVLAKFKDGWPAIVENDFGKGKAVYIGACPAIAYLKEANFVANDLKEQWPDNLRELINRVASQRRVPRLVDLSHPVVEAGVYDAEQGSALVLANFTYQPIQRLTIRVPVKREVKQVTSLEQGRLKFTVKPAAAPFHATIETEVPLKLTDILLLE